MTREEAINIMKVIVHMLEEKYDTDRVEEAVDMAIKVLEQEPTTKENLVVEDCISREFIEIVVDYPPADLCTYPEYKGKPYFSIKYRENGKEYVGFGTYKIEFLSQWIKEYFISDIQPKQKTEVLDSIRAEIKEWYWQADKQALAKDPCVVDAMIDLFIRTIDKYKAESEKV